MVKSIVGFGIPTLLLTQCSDLGKLIVGLSLLIYELENIVVPPT